MSEAPKATDVCEVCGRDTPPDRDLSPDEVDPFCFREELNHAEDEAECYRLGYSRATARAEEAERERGALAKRLVELEGRQSTIGALMTKARIALLESALHDCVYEMEEAASLLSFFPDDYGEAINTGRRALSGAQEVGNGD